jgi:hypothetical protein
MNKQRVKNIVFIVSVILALPTLIVIVDSVRILGVNSK